MEVKMTPIEKQMLWNQLQILRFLDGGNEGEYRRQQKILENGYSFDYGEVVISVGQSKELSREECLFVRDVFSMFEALDDCVKYPGVALPGHYTQFKGYDGNHEAALMGYARYLIEERGFWGSLDIKEFDSHFTTAPAYARMLAVWKTLRPKGYGELSPDEAIEIARAA